jgi:hypothetical protein
MSGMPSVDWKLVLSKTVTVGTKALVAAYVLKWFYEFLIRGGRSVGGDFFYYWWASQLAREGSALVVYDFSKFQDVLKMANQNNFPVAWFYPPTFLLLILPLSSLPYIASLLVWISVTLLGYRQVVLRIAPHPLTSWLLLAFPATLMNISYGQNGFLSAALLGGGLLLLDDFPLVAGILLGLLTYKPHLAVLVPVALIAGRLWGPFFGFLIASALMVMFSCFVFGFGPLAAFWENSPLAVKILYTGFQGQIQDWSKMISVFSGARLAGLAPSTALILQGAVMAAVLAVLTWVWSRKLPLSIRASVLTLAILLFTPHAFEYDLTLLAIAIAWMGWEGYTKGWMPGERIILSVAWFVPLLSTLMVKLTNIQLTPMFLITFLIFVLRRITRPVPLPHQGA